MKDYRWLAAPVITHRISDGVLVSPRMPRAKKRRRLPLGLNNVCQEGTHMARPIVCAASVSLRLGGPGPALSTSHGQSRAL